MVSGVKSSARQTEALHISSPKIDKLIGLS